MREQNKPVELKTTRLLLRRYKPDDLDDLIEYAIWLTAGINIGDFSNGSYAVSDFYDRHSDSDWSGECR
jgi:hypothetical protein